MPTESSSPVYVVGGGWAGLAAAVELIRRGREVVLIESARQLGGRARRVLFDETGVDNGQHLLIGAYRSTLDLMRLLGVEDNVMIREPLTLSSRAPDGRTYRLKAAPLPTPWHLAWGLLTARGYSWRERLGALRFCRHLQKRQFTLAADCSVAELLQRHHQSQQLTENLWEPLCLAALNTPLERASAAVFLRVLGEAFAGDRHASDLLYTRRDLSALLPDPAQAYIEERGGSTRLGRRVTGLAVEGDRIAGLRLDAESIPAHRVILATPPAITERLIAPWPALKLLARDLGELGTQPICTVYFQYPETVTTGDKMLGLSGTLAQWIFDRGIYGQAGLMALVISGPGAHMAMDNETLAATVSGELASLFPDWPAPQRHLVIREKRATFDCRVGIDRLRPGHATPIDGLWLAGDYTDTGLPATLEGAVRSGRQCAAALLQGDGTPS